MTLDPARLAPGDSAPEVVDGPLTVHDIVCYQAASGDLNPLHHDPVAAARAGYPGPFSVGMLQGGIMATQVTDWLGAANIRRFKVQFRELAWPGDVLVYRATVAAVQHLDDEIVVEVEMSVSRGAGGIHARGWATFSLTPLALTS